MRRRCRAWIQAELEELRARLRLYLEKEEAMLSGNGIKRYRIGTREAERYDVDLKNLQDAIRALKKRIQELEDELCGRSPRRAIGVVPQDW